VDQTGSALHVPVAYLPPEPKGSWPALEELEELNRLSVSIDRRMHQTSLPKYLSNGRIVTQNNLDMFTLYLSQQDVREETIGRRSTWAIPFIYKEPIRH
jgi:hypothetical protein